MNKEGKTPKQISIVNKLFKIVFGIYFSITIILTISQMVSEYVESEKNIIEELKDVQKAFDQGLADAMWMQAHEQAEILAKGMLNIPVIRGIEIIEENNLKIQVGDFFKKKNSTLGFFHKSNLYYHDSTTPREKIGEIKIYSTGKEVLNRVKYGWILLIGTAVVKTILLFLLFFWAFKRFLMEPLFRLTTSAGNINFNQLEDIEAKLDRNEYNELNILENSLNKTIKNLRKYKRNLVNLLEEKGVMVVKLSDLNDNLKIRYDEVSDLNKTISELNKGLEQKVNERTEDLRQSLEATEGMFSKINKAIFTANHQGTILTPVSSFSKTIFEEDILGKNALKLLFFHLKEGSKEKDHLLCGWSFLFDGDEIHFESAQDYLPKKVIQPDKKNTKGKVLEINYVPLFSKDKKVEKIMFIVDDVTQIEQEYMQNRDSSVILSILKEVLAYKNKDILSHQLAESMRTSAYALEELLAAEAENFGLEKIKSRLENLFNRLKVKELQGLYNFQSLIKLLKHETTFKENIEGKKAQVWSIEKVSFLLEYLMKYGDAFNFMSDHNLSPKIDNTLFAKFENKVSEKKSDVDRVMVNLLEYVFLVRKTSLLNEENIKNAPKKARLYGEFDNIIFYLQIQSKFISFLLKMFRKDKAAEIYMEFATLLEHMPSKDKLTVPSLKNHLITPYINIEELKE